MIKLVVSTLLAGVVLAAVACGAFADPPKDPSAPFACTTRENRCVESDRLVGCCPMDHACRPEGLCVFHGDPDFSDGVGSARDGGVVEQRHAK